MKITWVDLPEKKNCFTVRSALMIDLDTRRVVQYYSANTKIVVTQKCIIKEGTFYRTETAKRNGLNWAFKASAFGLPNEVAPSAHSHTHNSQNSKARNKASCSSLPKRNKKDTKKGAVSKDGETRHRGNWLKRLFRRKNG